MRMSWSRRVRFWIPGPSASQSHSETTYHTPIPPIASVAACAVSSKKVDHLDGAFLDCLHHCVVGRVWVRSTTCTGYWPVETVHADGRSHDHSPLVSGCGTRRRGIHRPNSTHAWVGFLKGEFVTISLFWLSHLGLWVTSAFEQGTNGRCPGFSLGVPKDSVAAQTRPCEPVGQFTSRLPDRHAARRLYVTSNGTFACLPSRS